ncbi:MAG: hypothetical protein WA735_04565, partial [Candidatus Acidiferrales bacterium]
RAGYGRFDQVSIGFEVPASKPDVAPNIPICTQTTSLYTLAQHDEVKEEEWLPDLYDLRTFRFEVARGSQ